MSDVTEKYWGGFDRERMERALASERILIPHGLTPEEIVTFLTITEADCCDAEVNASDYN